MSIADLRPNRGSETVGIYAIGFLDASATLFEKAAKGRGLVDLTFYPAAYCLRHGLELLAKQMSVYFAYESRDTELLYSRGHSFEELWQTQSKQIEELADSAWATVPNLMHHLDVLDGTVAEFQELDPSGTLFRYPEDIFRDKETSARVRTDRHVPFDAVNMEDWYAIAEATLGAAQMLLGEVGARMEDLRAYRNDPPLPFADLVKRPA